jgi:hypothetical protein
MAHANNPSYSEGRDQEDCSLKPAWANGSWNPILKRADGVTQGIGPEFKNQYSKKEKKKNLWHKIYSILLS